LEVIFNKYAQHFRVDPRQSCGSVCQSTKRKGDSIAEWVQCICLFFIVTKPLLGLL